MSVLVFSVWLIYNCSIFYFLLDGTSHKSQISRSKAVTHITRYFNLHNMVT